MRTLVTGGAGFIGSHLTDALIIAGARVLVVDNLRTGRIDNLQSALSAGAEITEADVRHAESIERVVSLFRPEVIFHFAAHVNVHESANSPAFDATTNVLGGLFTLID